MSMVGGTPKWAELKKDRDEDADSDDEFFRVRRFCFEKFGLLHFSILVTYLFPCSGDTDSDTALRGFANPP